MTKSVRSVCSSATARISSAFSSARMRKDIRLLSSTATLGMAETSQLYVFKVYTRRFETSTRLGLETGPSHIPAPPTDSRTRESPSARCEIQNYACSTIGRSGFPHRELEEWDETPTAAHRLTALSRRPSRRSPVRVAPRRTRYHRAHI